MTEDTQITDGKKRYSAGVLRYKQMGYWDPDYQPKETDLIAMFRMTPQEGVDPKSAQRPWPANLPPPPGRWYGPTA